MPILETWMSPGNPLEKLWKTGMKARVWVSEHQPHRDVHESGGKL